MDPIWRRIERTLRRRLPTGQCASIVGDLAEEYAARRQVGRLRAALWLRREARSITRAYQIDAGALESPRIAQPLDLRIALRAMARRPGLAASRFATVTVVVTAVSAVFTVASASFLRPLPFPDAKRLLLVYAQPPGTTSFASRTPLHPMSFSRLQTAVQAFDRFEGQWAAERAIGGEGEPESVQTARVSAGWFDMLGATFTAGRGFSDREVAGNANVAVISHGFWSRRFGGRPGAIGTMVLIDREPHQIIGVIAPGFVSAFVPVEVWSPLNVTAIETQNFTPIRGVARLREGTSLSEAQSELAARFAPVRDELPQVLGGWSLRATGLQEAMFGDRRAGLLALLAAVIVLAVIAAANLANLTLADAIHRRRDFAVRAALGGSRWQISAPDVAQGLVIAVVGGASGLLLASLVVPILIGLDPSGVYTAQQLAADWRVAASGFIVAGLVMIAAVGLPSLRASRSGLADGAGSRTIGAPRATRLRSVLVATQAALTMVLLSAGAVILGTLERSTRTAPGFEVTNVITAQLRLAERTLPDMTSRASFVRNVLERVRHTPGVVDAATTMNLFTSGGSFQTLVHIEHQPTPGGDPHAVQFRRAWRRFQRFPFGVERQAGFNQRNDKREDNEQACKARNRIAQSTHATLPGDESDPAQAAIS